ncbi:MAG: hypothetical protein Q9M32_06445 [Sulfurimonas sp.]|nr:hypothetical protein [Sulfurimonas sp.]MDQ7062377.1 hypothetical protein [Sulfurimonas sp.]
MDTKLQEKILDLWVCDVETIRIIGKTKITPSQFKKMFAAKIFQYLLDVYTKKTQLGDCPVVFAMLTIFKRSNLSITEIHHVCDTFKLQLTLVLFENNEAELATQLLGILRENFKGVLKSFMDIKYDINIGELSIVNEGNYLTANTCAIQPEIEIKDKVELEESFNSSEESDYIKNYVNTAETEEEFEIIHKTLTGEILDDFNDTNEMFFNLAVLEDTYTPKYHELLSNSIDIYISIFLDLLFFNKITTSLNDLKYLIADISIYSDDQLSIMKQLTESLMQNLSNWKEEIIDNKNKAIHYYDDAILGDIEQLKVMIAPENDDNGEDLDDIFDF